MTINAASALGQQMQRMAAQASQSGRSERVGAAAGAPAAVSAGQPDFAEALTQSIDSINALKTDAMSAGKAYEAGAPGVGLNTVMVDMAKADVATNLGIQTRNRVVSAYKEIMNMQV